MRGSSDARESHPGPRRTTIVFGAALLALALAVAAVAFAWARNGRHASAKDPGFDCPTVIHARGHAPFAGARVHRVTLIGDSIMFQASCALGESLAGAGITTYRHAVPGSGLLTGTPDWLAATRQLVRAEHPDIVLAIFVGNYAPPPLRSASGAVIERGSPAFFRAWQRKAQQLSAIVTASHARLYWVSPPPIDVPGLSVAGRLFAGYRTIRGDQVVNAGAALAGPNGKEVFAKDSCGRREVIRTTIDGVHLTPDGARIYGQEIAHDLTAHLALIPTPKPC